MKFGEKKKYSFQNMMKIDTATNLFLRKAENKMIRAHTFC